MANTIFDEAYGTVSRGQRAAYRKHNVSPSDHDTLVSVFGNSAHEVITRAVKDMAQENGGYYNPGWRGVQEYAERKGLI